MPPGDSSAVDQQVDVPQCFCDFDDRFVHRCFVGDIESAAVGDEVSDRLERGLG